MKRYIYLLIGLLIVFAFSACEDLEVENINQPTLEEINTPAQANGAAASLFNSIFSVSHMGGLTADEPLLAWFNAADVGSCSWGNFGMRDISSEPRIEYNNTPAYPNGIAVTRYYQQLYSYLSSANDLLVALTIDEDSVIEEPARVKALAKYAQAYYLGHIGMAYDQAFVVTEYNDVLEDEIELLSYDIVIDSALAIIDQCIALCEDNEFEIPEEWLPTAATYTNVEMGELANTLGARLLTYRSRNAADNVANDWSAILAYAEEGITMDFAPIMNDVDWHNYYMWYQIRDGWGRIDMRIINMIDPGMDPWFPASGKIEDLPNNGVASNALDSRLGYFEYMDAQAFLAERGIYHYSTYRLQRYDSYKDSRTGALPVIMKWENDMIWAEALARTGDLTGAAAILNDAAGPRKVVGGMVDVAEDLAEILEAIYYEKTIECMLTTEMTEFYDMRRRDMLQAGTLLHLPIPAQQLEVLELPFYSFGGTTGVAGEDYSPGGWETVDGYKKSEYGY